MSRKAVCALALAITLAVPALTVYGKKSKTTAPETPAIAQMSADQKVVYALNRLAYGPRPGDVEAVTKFGLDKWIDLQLHPEMMRENPLLAAKLQPLDTLVLPADVMIESYPPPQLIRAMVDLVRAALPEDPLTPDDAPPGRWSATRKSQTPKPKPINLPRAQALAKLANEMAQVPDLDAVIRSLTPEQQNIIKNGTQLEKVKLLEIAPSRRSDRHSRRGGKQPQRQALSPSPRSTLAAAGFPS